MGSLVQDIRDKPYRTRYQQYLPLFIIFTKTRIHGIAFKCYASSIDVIVHDQHCILTIGFCQSL